MLITKHITLSKSNIRQFYFNLVCYLYMHATYFGLYFGHPQTYQHKIQTKK